MERWRVTLKVTRKWSDNWRSSAEQLEGERPEQQSMSSVWPLMWVGKSMNCWKPKLSKHDKKSRVRGRLRLSM